jgi:hypothetical protein
MRQYKRSNGNNNVDSSYVLSQTNRRRMQSRHCRCLYSVATHSTCNAMQRVTKSPAEISLQVIPLPRQLRQLLKPVWYRQERRSRNSVLVGLAAMTTTLDTVERVWCCLRPPAR